MYERDTVHVSLSCALIIGDTWYVANGGAIYSLYIETTLEMINEWLRNSVLEMDYVSEY